MPTPPTSTLGNPDQDPGVGDRVGDLWLADDAVTSPPWLTGSGTPAAKTSPIRGMPAVLRRRSPAPRRVWSAGSRRVSRHEIIPLPQMWPVSRARIHPKTPRSAGKLPSVRRRSRKGAKRLRLRQPGVASPEGASVDGHHAAAKRGEDPDGAAEAMKR